MTIIYILLGFIILNQIRIFGIVKANKIELQDLSPKIHLIYEQLLKEKIKKENREENQKDWREIAKDLGIM